MLRDIGNRDWFHSGRTVPHLMLTNEQPHFVIDYDLGKHTHDAFIERRYIGSI